MENSIDDTKFESAGEPKTAKGLWWILWAVSLVLLALSGYVPVIAEYDTGSGKSMVSLLLIMIVLAVVSFGVNVYIFVKMRKTMRQYAIWSGGNPLKGWDLSILSIFNGLMLVATLMYMLVAVMLLVVGG